VPAAADRPTPHVSAVPFPAWLGNHPRPALQQSPPTTCIVGASPPLLGLDKKEPSPSPRASYCSPRRSRSLSPRKPQQPCTEVLRQPSSSPPHGPPSPSLPVLAFPRGENPLASLYLPVPLISIFLASSALAACARVLLATIHGDRRHGSTLWPSSWPSLDPPLPRFFPVPSDMHSVARGAITELASELSPPAMVFCRQGHCSGHQFLLSPSLGLIRALHP